MHAARVALAAIIMAGSVACSGDLRGDKLGTGTTVIRLATIDDVNNNGQSFGPEAFVRALAEVSGGKLRAEVDLDTFSGGDADDESDLVRAIATGAVDGGWPSVRAFAEADIPGLELVEAPLTLINYDAVRELDANDNGVVTFDNTAPRFVDYDYAAGWHLEGGVLTFDERGDAATPAHLFVNPWTRIS